MPKEFLCPQCDQSDQVEKVSTIYLVGIGLNRQPVGGDGQDNLPFKLDGLPTAQLRNLARSLKPPASTRRVPTRPLHPDLIVITFSLILPLFLYGIYSTQVSTLLPVSIFLVLVYLLYFWKRKSIVARFESRQAVQRQSDDQVRKAIERWMRLYYCARDDVVFEPGNTELVAPDVLMAYLLRA